MSFVDTMGPFVLCVLLGLAAVIGVIAWIFLYLMPLGQERHVRTTVTRGTILYNSKARQFVDEIIAEQAETPVLPDRIMREAFALRDLSDDSRRGIQ